MRRVIVAVGAVVFLAISASPAVAARAAVNAAENATRWDSTEGCGILVDDFAEMEVNLFCFVDGRAWVKVKVPDVAGRVTAVKARGTGDCSGKTITYRQRGNVVNVKITHDADADQFDCYYSTVVVRHTG
jgi:hypothetical protein